MGNFKSDLSVGKQFEQLIFDRYTAKGLECAFNPASTLDKMREYDLTININGKIVKVECKMDRLASVTGNVAVELGCIRHSKADIFCYLISGKIHWITKEELLRLYTEKKYKRLTCSRENDALLFLISVDVFKEHCKIIVDINNESQYS